MIIQIQIVACIVCCAFAQSVLAGSEQAAVQSSVSPSPDNDRKAEESLITVLKARQKDVYALLDQFAAHGVPWRLDKTIRDGYDKLENGKASNKDVLELSQSVLHTLVTLPYRHPLKDKDLLGAVLEMCFYTDEHTANGFMEWLTEFTDIPESSIERVMSLIISRPEGRPLLHIPISDAMRKKYHTFFQKQIDREKRNMMNSIKM